VNGNATIRLVEEAQSKRAPSQSFVDTFSMYYTPAVVGIAALLAAAVTVAAAALLLGWAMWFFRNVASGLVTWIVLVGLGVAILAYAEKLPLADRMFARQSARESQPLSPIRARLKSPAFLLSAGAFVFVSLLIYGQFVYDQVPPVFGGGLPIVVRFLGDDVEKLEQIGIRLEPGRTDVTERVELIAQTEDRFIVRAGDRAVSFDQSFVQGIRYEPPEFFLNPDFIRSTHTKQGELYLADERYDEALSEFDLVLRSAPTYAPALHGRVSVSLFREDFDQALQDLDVLTQVEPNNEQNYYDQATVHVQRGVSIDVEDMEAALEQAIAISPTLVERARVDPAFDPLRPHPAFDRLVYGSGPDGARWHSERARESAESGALDDAITAYRHAITYTQAYSSVANALTPSEAAKLHIDLSTVYLQRDLRSEEAVTEMGRAVAVPGLSVTEVADAYVVLSGIYLRRDAFSEDAVKALQAAVDATGGQDAKYLNRLADLYRARNESAQALEIYGAALRLSTADDANRREALIGQGRAALEAQQYELASAAFSQALTLAPGDASTLYDYARVQAALQDPSTEAVLRAALELDSSLADRAQRDGDDWQRYFSNAGTAVANLIDGAVAAREARALRDQGDPAGAIAAYQKAAAADPSVAAYWVDLGSLLAQEKRYTEAAVAYQNALARLTDPSARLAVLGALGDAQIEASDYTGAINSYTEVINAQPDAASAALYARLARAYELTGQNTLAAATYQQAALRAPDDLTHPYRAGLNLLLAGQIEPGLAALKPIIDQGGLRVEASDGVGLRADATPEAAVQTTLAIGTIVRIAGEPRVNEGQVWWPVVNGDGMSGWVRAAGVVPAPPPVLSVPPAIQEPPATPTVP
jgi:tetratricopeptide (TPR) repeat protein